MLDSAERYALIKDERPKLDAIKGFRHIHQHMYDIVLDQTILKARALALAEMLPSILDRINLLLSKVTEHPSDTPPGTLG